LRKFHQIHNLGAVVDKDELIKFSGQRSRLQQGQISTFGGMSYKPIVGFSQK